MDQDDQLLQFAIQQSLMESENSDTSSGQQQNSQSQQLNLTEALQSFSQESDSPHPARRTTTSPRLVCSSLVPIIFSLDSA